MARVRQVALGLNERTAGKVRSFEINPERDWTLDAPGLAAYAWETVQSNAAAAAIMNARLALTFGPRGLEYTPGSNNDNTAAAAESAAQWLRLLFAPGNTGADATGALNGTAVARLLDLSAGVAGGGWAVKQFRARAGVPFATHWRLVGDERICTPAELGGTVATHYRGEPIEIKKANRFGVPVGHSVWHGMETDKHGSLVAVLIAHPEPHVPVYLSKKFTRHPIFDRNGERAVLHRQDPHRPGVLRSLSDLAPILETLRAWDGVREAHVVGKRLQASQAGKYVTDNAERIKAMRNSGAGVAPGVSGKPGQVVVHHAEDNYEAPQINYQGADWRDFDEAMARACCAAVGLPWRYVLCHIDGVSMASGRVFLAQAQRRGEHWQDAAIGQTLAPMVRAHLREGIARGYIRNGDNSRPDLDLLMAGDWLRPSPLEIDPKGTAAAAEIHRRLGVSGTTVLRDLGKNHEREQRLAATEAPLNPTSAALAKLTGPAAANMAQTARQNDDDNNDDEDEDE